MARAILPLQERFMRHVEPEPNSGCWLWTGSLFRNGYGKFSVVIDGKRSTQYAHRVAWESANGPIPLGMCVLHSCDVRSCVLAEHLFLGTKQDNSADMARKGRGIRSKSGLPYGVGYQPGSLKNPYYAKVGVSNKQVYLGRFSTPEEAGRAAQDFNESTYKS